MLEHQTLASNASVFGRSAGCLYQRMTLACPLGAVWRVILLAVAIAVPTQAQTSDDPPPTGAAEAAVATETVDSKTPADNEENDNEEQGTEEQESEEVAVEPAADTTEEPDPYAELPGQADLDKATILKLSASSMGDLETVVDLCQKAIKAGLDEGSEAYANELMASTLFEQASRLSRLIFDQQPPDPRWPRIRQICLQKAQESLSVDQKNGKAHLLIARLNGMRGGDRALATESVKEAIKLLEDPRDLSQAYQIKAGLTESPIDRLELLNKAIELAPANQAAWRARGLHYLTTGNTEKALEDLQHLLEENPNDLVAHQAIAQMLTQQEKFDEALAHLDKVIERSDRAILAYNLRARIREQVGNVGGAMEDLNRVVQLNPRDIGAILSRARLRLGEQQFDLARSDIKRVLQIQPGMPQAILMRSLLSAAQGRTSEAIGDLRLLIKQNPNNAELKIQLATFYEFDKRPRRAIKLYDSILEQTPDNLAALRRRGDVLLSIGQHKEAVDDYKTALKLAPEDQGILNNLAWVMCTSPMDNVRDGNAAIELAKKACEATSYKAPHIISTLAASYAEVGNFEKAIEWSEKAVAMESDQQDQLAKELEAYREGKPWRELQELEENAEALEDENDELPDFEIADDPEPALEPQEEDSSADEEAADEEADATAESNEETEEAAPEAETDPSSPGRI